MPSNKLTIFLPTFNRSKSIINQIEFLIAEEIHKKFKIVIINDGSTDDTRQKLLRLELDSNFILIDNNENLGYAQTHINCFKMCTTDYLLFLTDDDEYFSRCILNIENLLDRFSPDFLSCSWNSSTSTRIFKSTKDISFFNIWKSAKHAPGLIYKVSPVRKLIDKLQIELKEKNLVAHFFPQIYLLFHLKSRGYCLMQSSEVIGKNPFTGSLPTNAKDENGDSYFSLSNIIERHITFQNFYEDLFKEYHHKEIELIKSLHRLTLHNQINQGIHLDFDEMSKDYRASSLLSSFRIRNFFHSYQRISWIKLQILFFKIFTKQIDNH
ncbi:MAG: glycosyltransferase family 2 protein [Flavobacteriaceae bacterium]